MNKRYSLWDGIRLAVFDFRTNSSSARALSRASLIPPSSRFSGSGKFESTRKFLSENHEEHNEEVVRYCLCPHFLLTCHKVRRCRWERRCTGKKEKRTMSNGGVIALSSRAFSSSSSLLLWLLLLHSGFFARFNKRSETPLCSSEKALTKRRSA